MVRNRLEIKILGITGLVVAFSFIIAFTANAIIEIRSLKRESKEKSRLIGETIARSIRTIMLTGNGDIASQWTDDLRMINRLEELYVIELNGMLAFRSTDTLKMVNRALGKEIFNREELPPIRIMDENDERLQRVISTRREIEYIQRGPDGSIFVQIKPIFSGIRCKKCHSKEKDILGLLQIATSVREVDKGINHIIKFAVAASLSSIAAVIVLLWLLFRLFVTRPISKVADTIKDIIESRKLEKMVHYKSRDEIGSMVENFNIMTRRLNKLYRTLEDKVEERTRQLIHAEKVASAGQLATGLIHEIRNPLSGIKLSIQLLEAEVDEGLRGDVKEISREIHRIESLLNDLLRFARPHPPVFTVININDVIERAVSLTRRRAEKSNIELAIDLAPEIPMVKADPDLLQQVFLNLVINAIQAMPDGGKLTVKTGAFNGFVTASFTDTGHGISKDYIGKIFDPFFTTKGSSGGSGLGLSISYRIIEEHGGKMEVESTEGKGTTFTVSLKEAEESE